MKISKIIQVTTTLITALVLSACAGTHPKPPSVYYTKVNDADTLRVAFDQNGHIYPISSEAWNWNSYEFQNHWICKITGCSYQLMKLQRDGEHVYNPVKDRNDNVAHVINDLNKLLLDKDKLAIFIHGFNNDYGDAQAIYKEFRSRMDNTAILEVYWDGVENKVPLKIWFPSLTYSNLAGQIGLRPIINGINKPVDLIVVTHSRGAAVAISTFSDPIYDPGICAPQEEKNPICDPKACECETLEVCLCTSQKEIDNTNNIFLGYTEPDLTHIKSLAFVFFAPAIGNGHFWEGIDKYFPEGKVVDFYLGTNPKDFATSKSIVPSQAFGDTSLGGDQEAIDRVIDTYSNNSEKIHIQQVKFTHGSEHGIPGYFSKINKTKPECMFWASGLKKEKPEMCSLKPSQ